LRFHIGPLDRRELREYVERRLEVAGRDDNELFTDDAYDVLLRYTGGIPRLINTLCDTALLCAFADEKDVIEPADIRAAVEELGWQEHESITGIYNQLSKISRRVDDETHITQIEVRADGESLSVQSFPEGRIIIGRSPDNEIYIKSKFVSRHHAQIISDATGCTIEDLNSTNGVFLGEKQVKKYQLRDGDVISVGVHELIYSDLRSRGPLEDQVEDESGEFVEATADELDDEAASQ
jgi:hypothetical protein